MIAKSHFLGSNSSAVASWHTTLIKNITQILAFTLLKLGQREHRERVLLIQGAPTRCEACLLVSSHTLMEVTILFE